MNTEGVERIVVAEAGLDLGDHPVAEAARDETDGECRHGTYETGSRRDGEQTGNGSGDRAQGTGPAVANPFCAAPSHHAGRGGEVSTDECTRRKTPGTERTS